MLEILSALALFFAIAVACSRVGRRHAERMRSYRNSYPTAPERTE